jgi:hypothetical protein
VARCTLANVFNNILRSLLARRQIRPCLPRIARRYLAETIYKNLRGHTSSYLPFFERTNDKENKHMKPKESIMKFAEAGIQGLETVTGGWGQIA